MGEERFSLISAFLSISSLVCIRFLTSDAERSGEKPEKDRGEGVRKEKCEIEANTHIPSLTHQQHDSCS